MEFLRFGSSIPGAYWGCCAVDIIQNFGCDPETPQSISLCSGDGASPIMIKRDGKRVQAFAGPTARDIFRQRLRFGTFDKRDMPNHGFLAVLTDKQLRMENGLKWLKILKEEGFEFIRAVDNSVYSGSGLIDKAGQDGRPASVNYLFGLFRNIGKGCIDNPYEPPKEWTDLPSVVPEAWEQIKDGKDLNVKVQAAQLDLFNKLPTQDTLMSEEELEKAKVPITYHGKRSEFPQEGKELRRRKEEARKRTTSSNNAGLKAAPFGQ